MRRASKPEPVIATEQAHLTATTARTHKRSSATGYPRAFMLTLLPVAVNQPVTNGGFEFAAKRRGVRIKVAPRALGAKKRTTASKRTDTKPGMRCARGVRVKFFSVHKRDLLKRSPLGQPEQCAKPTGFEPAQGGTKAPQA